MLHKTVQEAIVIRKKSRNKLWQDAIQKKMENVKIAFQTMPEGRSHPMAFSMLSVTLCSTLKCSISKKGTPSDKRPYDP